MAQAASYIGCAGWSLPAALHSAFGDAGSHLQRYATRLAAVEIIDNALSLQPAIDKELA